MARRSKDVNVLNELEDFVGVEKFFEDEDVKKKLLKIKKRFDTSIKELMELGYVELIPPIRRVTKALREVSE